MKTTSPRQHVQEFWNNQSEIELVYICDIIGSWRVHTLSAQEFVNPLLVLFFKVVTDLSNSSNRKMKQKASSSLVVGLINSSLSMELPFLLVPNSRIFAAYKTWYVLSLLSHFSSFVHDS